MKKVIVAVVIFMLTGCASLPNMAMYTPPKQSEDVAKIRFIGRPKTFAIYQKDDFGKESGGWVSEQDIYMNITPGKTQDIGLPKISGKVYGDEYFETLLEPNKYTRLRHVLYGGCAVDLPFVPEKRKIYEATIDYGVRSGVCVFYLKEIYHDKTNNIYLERDVKK
ncbi:hypothetical protein [Aeromonas hydrophila]|uniref:hypothetical protein n=1 Tax=Aeromonas hydrophila TaxID=644 RepID=UPI0009BE8561|nr:hypothetical protein [Aeromonas hydrophila]